MFDIQLRPLKDLLFDPCCRYIPSFITPLHVTALAFLCGLLSCFLASQQHHHCVSSLLLWGMNRSLDCVDGALARKRNTASELGGFLDLLGDFITYSLIPIAVAEGGGGGDGSRDCFRAVAVLEATFFINNFILFYIAAVAAKKGDAPKSKVKELTSVAMRPALIEGMESGVLFTAMLAFPSYIRMLSLLMAGLVSIGVLQRIFWSVQTLG